MPLRLALILLLFTTATFPSLVSRAADQPNILLILADDLGYQDLGFQNSPDIKSPNLDRLAANSIRFTDGYVTASVCSPSRAGLLTGRYQQRFGHESNSPPVPHGMDLNETTFAQHFKKLGYRTGIIGKWHLGYLDSQYPTSRGFDYFYGLRQGSRGYFHDPQKTDKPGNFKAIEENGKQVPFTGYLTDVFGQKAVDYIAQPSDKPFFLYLSFTAPHGPLESTEEDQAQYRHIEDPKRRNYAAMIWSMDRAIGAVLAQLDKQNITDNTLIWFLSDNGGPANGGAINLPLAGHKGIKFEGGIRVPFLLQWKDKFPKGQTFNSMVSAFDILPTSLAAAGGLPANAPRPLDGVNLLPHLTGKTQSPPHQKLYWHKLWFSAMRDGPWKIIYVKDYGYALYNLDNDLEERHNLATAHPDRLTKMTNDLNRWKGEMIEPQWSEHIKYFGLHTINHVNIIEGKDGR